jgi:predicted DNA binding CopG/RHH family protein
MKRMKLTPYEKRIEDEVSRGEWVPASKETSEMIGAAIARTLAERRKNSVLNLRINSNDLALLKEKAAKLGVKYQTFIAEYLHRLAHSGR